MKKNIKNIKGQTMTEYAIIVALIAIVCIGVVSGLGEQIKGVFQDATTELEEARDDSEE